MVGLVHGFQLSTLCNSSDFVHFNFCGGWGVIPSGFSEERRECSNGRDKFIGRVASVSFICLLERFFFGKIVALFVLYEILFCVR